MTTYPNVPNSPGVPPVNRAPNAPSDGFVPINPNAVTTQTLAPGFKDVGQLNSIQVVQYAWGIYDQSNTAVIVPDSFVSFEYSKEYRISNYPLEQGAFQSYNKVEAPYMSRVSMTKGGSNGDRSAFMDTLDAIAASTDLYNIITPEKTYINANITHVEYRRTSQNGRTLITAEITLEQVRTSATVALSNSKAPAASGLHDNGAVQPIPLSNIQSAEVATATGSTPAEIRANVSAIPMTANPNQTVTFNVANQPTRLNVWDRGGRLFMDVLKNDAVVLSGVSCLHADRIIRNSYFGYTGDFAWFDTQGKSDPTFDGIGKRFFLAYLGKGIKG